jgi:ribosome-binding ATPase YchF (GTP1/OBG family)
MSVLVMLYSICVVLSMMTMLLMVCYSHLFINIYSLFTLLVEGEVNPFRDLEIISQELILKDLNYLEGNIDKMEKLVARDKTKKPELETLLKVKELLDAKKFVRHHVWAEKDIENLNKHLFLTAKPVVYLVNLSEKDYIRKASFYNFIVMY